MSKSILNSFRVEGEAYQHRIDTCTDATDVITESGEVLYTVDSGANMFDRAGRIGKFRLDQNYLWYFEGMSGLVIETGNKNLIKAEMKVFKHFLAGI